MSAAHYAAISSLIGQRASVEAVSAYHIDDSDQVLFELRASRQIESLGLRFTYKPSQRFARQAPGRILQQRVLGLGVV